jgi:hypothetical protein
MNKSKAAIVVSQIVEKVQAIAGWYLVLCAVAALIGCTSTSILDGATFVAILILGGGGAAFISAGKKRKKLRLSFKKYVAVLSADPTGSIENMAAAVGTSVDACKADLQKMIDKKFFTTAYIDRENNRLVIPTVTAPDSNTAAASERGSESASYVSCNCPNCGGINKIMKGMVSECDFCGSPLQG